MSKVVDLSLLTGESLVLKFGEDDVFTIPADPTNETVYKIMDYYDKMGEVKSNRESIEILSELVAFILNQDVEREINKEFVDKNIKISQQNKIIQLYKDKIQENAQNPN
ncbi:hypothetical protein [Halalkalibacter sp. APA_J-10(15)]|uniref:hypothetical protein n=1 Tax=Halalkalibacter sp. APA_J-10(15) TaxID=2933805 RepID=UPI001FF22F86|nr:hypothetical protein [Halalkalibacter sp. APA_J-10(15)]MCK0470893.1 hypothetical protein [Halalkalibacter sp. APA_J-10(15)]